MVEYTLEELSTLRAMLTSLADHAEAKGRGKVARAAKRLGATVGDWYWEKMAKEVQIDWLLSTETELTKAKAKEKKK